MNLIGKMYVYIYIYIYVCVYVCVYIVNNKWISDLKIKDNEKKINDMKNEVDR